MRAWAGLVLLCLAMPCAAESGRSYSILSIVGDRLSVTGRPSPVGSPSRETYVDLGDPAIDAAVLRAVSSAVTRIEPGVKTTLLLPRSPRLFTAQENALEESRSVRVLFDAIRPLVGDLPGTHLILVSKLRHAARIRFNNEYFDASPRLQGAGFYIDRAQRVADASTGEGGYGFLGVFAYFKVSLIDLAGGRVPAEEEMVASAAYGQHGKDPWDGVSAEDKVGMLKGLIGAETGRVVARLLSAR
jgi:hypothetical protein